MIIPVELSPAIEKQISAVAARYNLDAQEVALQWVRELVADVERPAPNQPDAEQMLVQLASRMQANREQARAAQIERNQAAIALLRAWRVEDANVDEQEKAAREAEGRALEEGLAAHPFTLRDWAS